MFAPLKILSICVGASLFLGPTGAQAELRDPMLPPAQFMGGMESALPMGGGGSVRQPVVQVLLIGHDRQSAVIDGQVLKRGEQLDQWRLISIHDKGVVLRGNEGTQAVSAFPAVKKKTSAGPSTGSGSKHTNP